MRKADLVLIGGIILLAGCAAAWLHFASPSAAGGDAVVVCQTQSGFRRVTPLSQNETYTVTTPGHTSDDPGTNVISIEDGTVRVTSANCSNQVCVQHAPIDEIHQQIVCLPHGLVVEIVANEDDATILNPSTS